MRFTRLLSITLFSLVAIAGVAHAEATTAEAQSFYDAYTQTTLHVFSQYMLAYALVAVFGAALFLLLNLRTLSYLCFIAFGAVVLVIPYYIPTNPQMILGCGVIFLGLVGLLTRAFAGWKYWTNKKNPSA